MPSTTTTTAPAANPTVIPAAQTVKTYQAVSATARQIEALGVKVNGNIVDATALSVMARYGIVQVQGTLDKLPHQRGKAPSVYSLQGREGFIVEFVEPEPEKITKLSGIRHHRRKTDRVTDASK